MENDLELNIYSPFDVDMSNPRFDWVRFKEQKDKMPESIRNLIFDVTTATFLKETIATKFGLTKQQSANLSRIVRDILIADIFIDSLAGEIQTKLGLVQGTAIAIADAITSQLFNNAMGEIKKIHSEKFKNADKPTMLQNQKQIQSLHEQNVGNVIDLRNNKN